AWLTRVGAHRRVRAVGAARHAAGAEPALGVGDVADDVARAFERARRLVAAAAVGALAAQIAEDAAAARGLADTRARVAVCAAIAAAAGRRRGAAVALESVDGAGRASDRLAGAGARAAWGAADAGAAVRVLVADVVGLPAERDRRRCRAGLGRHVAGAA